ncbi:MAG: hypothetical protein PUP92_01020 [Rhizonema sp. PD38]|nr:hypothetical protein [Rhizonema sp. PD38]
MIIDARTIAEDTVVDSNICIVGSGAAGITAIGIQVLWRGWLKLHDLCVRVASRRGFAAS